MGQVKIDNRQRDKQPDRQDRTNIPALCASLQVANYFLGYCDSGGYHGCIFRGFSQTVFMMASRLMVVLMSVERFIALRYPFKYSSLMSKERVIGAVVGLGIYAIFVSCLPIMGVNSYGYQSWCDFHWNDRSLGGRFFVLYFVFEGFTCMAIIVFCNISAIYELLRMNKVRPLDTGSKMDKDQTKFIVMMVAISVVYIVFSSPLLVRLFCNQLEINLSKQKDFVGIRLNIVNNMMNAHLFLFIQFLFHPKVLEKWRRCFGRGRNEDPSSTIPTTTTS
ncbi:prostaglandin F2-alpha receptor-like [Saccostrea cucullata]|uniref:prostaglandin F2-alpha receptor-like n=1 Tax=Saccostrea cuccullata TaxID=36930 RepID=UPI002ED294F7